MECIEEQLKQLIAEYGKQLVVDEPRRTAALLRDLFAQYKREARVLISVIEEGLTVELVRDAGKTSAAILLPRQAKRLHDELGIDEKLALWAVSAWAEALGWSLPAPKVATAAKPAAAQIRPTSTPKKAPAQQKTQPLIGGHYLDNGDGTVSDTQTSLQWMRCSLGQGLICS